MSAPQRAILAAEILDGRIVLTELTAKSVAALTGTSLSSVYAALRCSDEQRAAVFAGDRPLQSRPRPQAADGINWWKPNDDEIVAAIQRLEALTEQRSPINSN
jgi:hypothetical protein